MQAVYTYRKMTDEKYAEYAERFGWLREEYADCRVSWTVVWQ
jgi:hypothetical protein